MITLSNLAQWKRLIASRLASSIASVFNNGSDGTSAMAQTDVKSLVTAQDITFSRRLGLLPPRSRRAVTITRRHNVLSQGPDFDDGSWGFLVEAPDDVLGLNLSVIDVDPPLKRVEDQAFIQIGATVGIKDLDIDTEVALKKGA